MPQQMGQSNASQASSPIPEKLATVDPVDAVPFSVEGNLPRAAAMRDIHGLLELQKMAHATSSLKYLIDVSPPRSTRGEQG